MPKNRTRRNYRGGMKCFGGICGSKNAVSVEEPGKKPNGNKNTKRANNGNKNKPKINRATAKEAYEAAMQRVRNLETLKQKRNAAEREAMADAKQLALEMAKLEKEVGGSKEDIQKVYRETYAKAMREFHSSNTYKQTGQNLRNTLSRNLTRVALGNA